MDMSYRILIVDDDLEIFDLINGVLNRIVWKSAERVEETTVLAA
jgi:two-component SAPR family response regulator